MASFSSLRVYEVGVFHVSSFPNMPFLCYPCYMENEMLFLNDM